MVTIAALDSLSLMSTRAAVSRCFRNDRVAILHWDEHMRLELLVLFALCGCSEAAAAAVADDDGHWLLDPVGEVLAATDTRAAGEQLPTQPREVENLFSV